MTPRASKTASAETSAYVALLRGINVGGKNMLPMKELAALCAKAGCEGTKTYIQSGNVVFTATARIAAELPAVLARAIEGRYSIRVPVIVRSVSELESVSRKNPFLGAGADPDHLHVMFLSVTSAARAVATLDPVRSTPDAFEVRGGEIYLRCPNGLARTKLTNAYFDKALSTTSTCRNWRTVLKLLELATELE